MQTIKSISLSIIIFGAVLLNLSYANEQPTQDLMKQAKTYYDQGDYQTVITLLNKLAEQGNAQAMNNLGYMYANGEGVTTDNTRAMYWMLKAAKGGSMQAMKNLGFAYYDGKIVIKDEQQSLDWFSKCAQLDDTTCMRRVAHLYLRSKTIKRNPELAKKWLTKSAELGDEEAKKTLKTEKF
ncbi:hypothetical protein DKL61_01590 [Gammaproteobacteria bacterium ESL0073]|nr:hypothetical protein DKL61_01590 [Gammaproteobacteria bacterium ESL0073]